MSAASLATVTCFRQNLKTSVAVCHYTSKELGTIDWIDIGTILGLAYVVVAPVDDSDTPPAPGNRW